MLVRWVIHWMILWLVMMKGIRCRLRSNLSKKHQMGKYLDKKWPTTKKTMT
jgi:hypothetical protein